MLILITNREKHLRDFVCSYETISFQFFQDDELEKAQELCDEANKYFAVKQPSLHCSVNHVDLDNTQNCEVLNEFKWS